MCAGIYTWHSNDKPMLIMMTIMLSSFSGSVGITVSIKQRPYHFQQQIMEKILPVPEHLKSRYHKGQDYVPP